MVPVWSHRITRLTSRTLLALDSLVAHLLQAVSEASSFLTNFGSKFNITATGVRTSLFERLTLNCVKGLTLPTDRIFYFHSKGAVSASCSLAIR